MDVFIYIPPHTGIERDFFEDTLDDAIGALGGGIGENGMSIDLDVEDDVAPEEIVNVIRSAMAKLQAPYTKIGVAGKTFTW